VTEPDDVTRRTYLAAERTWLAWWRTGIAAVVAALAVGGVLPELVDRTRWPYVALGCAYAATGVALFVAGALRQRALDRALRERRYHALPDAWLLSFSVTGAVLAGATLVVLLLG
jgi:putative membrane protein